jgi:hypothetical protein
MTQSTRDAVAELLEAHRGSSTAFELAYQARIAVQHIRFAIRQLDGHPSRQVLTDVSFQLLDALDRLETADRHFQECHVPRRDSSSLSGE